jgi:ribonuclease III
MTSPDSPSPYAALEEKLGHRFRNISLCENAVTHRSWLNEANEMGRSDNERLEFLGDSVLSLAISDILMRRFPEQPEGELSKARSALVNEAGLARVSDGLQLGQWIFLGRGEEQAGGRQKRSLLSNALEALIGAVYLDGGFAAAFRVVERLFQPVLADTPATTSRDFKSRLQEVSQARLQLAPVYTVIGQHGPDHDKTFEVAISLGDKEYGRGQGKSKKEAQQSAAELALAQLAAEGYC